MQLFKSCVRIDISKSSFTACICQVNEKEELIFKEPVLKSKVDKLIIIKAVGVLTIATILAETLGFEVKLRC